MEVAAIADRQVITASFINKPNLSFAKPMPSVTGFLGTKAGFECDTGEKTGGSPSDWEPGNLCGCGGGLEASNVLADRFPEDSI